MNVKSMTGYGKAEKIDGNKKIIVEIRSLNSKQLDVAIKASQSYRAIEMDIRKLVANSAVRGKIDVTLTKESLDGSATATFNADAFKAYYKAISKTAKEIFIDVHTQDFVSSILRLPEVMVATGEEVSETETALILTCCTEALDALDSFRSKEGQSLIADILNRISIIEAKLLAIEPFETSRLDRIKSSIESELNQIKLNSEIDKNRFEQELIYYLEKIDITEEKVRLKQHCSFFRQTGSDEEMPGRKLGFIAQEIGREINTIGSKAGDVDIQKIVVEMKDELEKIKEQLLNIL